MEDTEFERAARRICMYYASGFGGYERAMDTMTATCSEAQWDRLCRYLDEVEEDMVDAGIGSEFQRDRVASRRNSAEEHQP